MKTGNNYVYFKSSPVKAFDIVEQRWCQSQIKTLHNLDLSYVKVNLGACQQGFMNCRKGYCAQRMNTSDPPIFINVFFINQYISFSSERSVRSIRIGLVWCKEQHGL